MNRDFARSANRVFARSPNRDRVSTVDYSMSAYLRFVAVSLSSNLGLVFTRSEVIAKKAAIFSALSGLEFPEEAGTDSYNFDPVTNNVTLAAHTPAVEFFITYNDPIFGPRTALEMNMAADFIMSHSPRAQLDGRVSMGFSAVKLQVQFVGEMINPSCVYQRTENNGPLGSEYSGDSCLRSRLLKSAGILDLPAEMFLYDPDQLKVEFAPPQVDPTESELDQFMFRSKNGVSNRLAVGIFATRRMMAGTFIGVDGSVNQLRSPNPFGTGFPIAPCCDIALP